MISYDPVPTQELLSPFLDRAGIRVFVRREDLNHPYVSGNKWWKLRDNLDEALRLGHHRVLTFGGAYSNHIYATAAAARELGFESIGIIRGEETHPLNPVLTFAKRQNMQLHYVSREEYRKKTDAGFLEKLRREFGNAYFIPEGGTNALAVKGCADWGRDLLSTNFDRVCLPVGTGGTVAGLIQGMEGARYVMGYAVLKGADFLKEEIINLGQGPGRNFFLNWEVITGYPFGGYAKTTQKLMDFIDAFGADYQIPLDPVYTGKMMFGIWDQIKQNEIPRGTTLLVLHTGGVH